MKISAEDSKHDSSNGHQALAVTTAQQSVAAMKQKNVQEGSETSAEGKPDLGTFWGLLILGLAYVHHSTSGYSTDSVLFCGCLLQYLQLKSVAADRLTCWPVLLQAVTTKELLSSTYFSDLCLGAPSCNWKLCLIQIAIANPTSC